MLGCLHTDVLKVLVVVLCCIPRTYLMAEAAALSITVRASSFMVMWMPATAEIVSAALRKCKPLHSFTHHTHSPLSFYPYLSASASPLCLLQARSVISDLLCFDASYLACMSDRFFEHIAAAAVVETTTTSTN